jgi:hypothetical protein
MAVEVTGVGMKCTLPKGEIVGVVRAGQLLQIRVEDVLIGDLGVRTPGHRYIPNAYAAGIICELIPIIKVVSMT